MSESDITLFHVDPKVRREAEEILSSLGLDPSVALDIFYRQVILSGGLPFQIRYPRREDSVSFYKEKSDGETKRKSFPFPAPASSPAAGAVSAPESSSEADTFSAPEPAPAADNVSASEPSPAAGTVSAPEPVSAANKLSASAPSSEVNTLSAPAAAPAADTFSAPEPAPAADTFSSPEPTPAAVSSSGADTYSHSEAAPGTDTLSVPAAAPDADTFSAPEPSPAPDTLSAPEAEVVAAEPREGQERKKKKIIVKKRRLKKRPRPENPSAEGEKAAAPKHKSSGPVQITETMFLVTEPEKDEDEEEEPVPETVSESVSLPEKAAGTESGNDTFPEPAVRPAAEPAAEAAEEAAAKSYTKPAAEAAGKSYEKPAAEADSEADAVSGSEWSSRMRSYDPDPDSGEDPTKKIGVLLATRPAVPPLEEKGILLPKKPEAPKPLPPLHAVDNPDPVNLSEDYIDLKRDPETGLFHVMVYIPSEEEESGREWIGTLMVGDDRQDPSEVIKLQKPDGTIDMSRFSFSPNVSYTEYSYARRYAYSSSAPMTRRQMVDLACAFIFAHGAENLNYFSSNYNERAAMEELGFSYMGKTSGGLLSINQYLRRS